jgi:hypothetical protein
MAQADLYMQDLLNDDGTEPRTPTATDPLWESPDIWVRQNAISGYTPYPYNSAYPFPASSSPLWLTALGSSPNQSPLYRDPLLSQPNYVYVRVHNRGTMASTGTEQLHVYWSQAATGLSWPTSWVDYMASTCGASTVYGMEITKPRMNIATAPLSQVQNYVNAIQQLATTPIGSYNYWFKQNETHYYAVYYADMSICAPDAEGNAPEPACLFSAHWSDGFSPWHREFINRYEQLLREFYPTVTLMYWDWTTDPRSWPSSLLSVVTPVIGGFSGGIGSTFYGVTTPPGCAFAPCVLRETGAAPSSPESTPDATIYGQATYSDYGAWNEGRSVLPSGPNNPADEAHNYSHPFIGGSGNMSDLFYAAQDPFFFLLHANVDKIWSEWQRNLSASGTYGSRYDHSSYSGGTVAYTGTMNVMTGAMAPWNGYVANGSSGAPPSPLLHPWAIGDPYTSSKAANDPSVVFPPTYDTAALTIPVLQPGQTVVIEIPWYPPNPANYAGCASTFGAGHVCLLARLETSTGAPYQNNNPETSDLYNNVLDNNWIAWHNEDVIDPPGPLLGGSVLVRNVLSNATTIQLGLTLSSNNAALLNYGQVILDLGTLYNSWFSNGAVAQQFVPIGGTQLQLTGTNGLLSDITVAANEVDSVQVELLLKDGYPNPEGQVFTVDLTQYQGVVGQGNQVVGGQNFTFDFNQLSLVPQNGVWLYQVTNQPASNWNQVGYNDSSWPSGAGKLGYGVGDEATVISSGPPNNPDIATYFRYDFGLQDTNLYTNLWLRLEAYDGAVVYLNGVEIQRLRMPSGPITPDTLASTVVTGLPAETYYVFNVSSYLSLLSASNVVAAEVHLGATNGIDMGFDLQLEANVAEADFPPQASFLPQTNGSLYLLGQPIPMTVNAIGPVNPVASVTFYADGAPIGTVTQPPYSLTWSNAPLGIHQLTAMPKDTFGLVGYAFASVQVLSNLPPTILITSPSNGQTFSSNAMITFAATAGELGGSIQKVEFFKVQHDVFINAANVLVGTAAAPPYQVTLSGLAPTNNLLYAVATDNLGVRAYAVPVHIMIVAPPSLTINYAAPNAIVNWTPATAVLQRASSISGPWQTLTNAPPYKFVPTNASIFFRAYSP